MKYLKLLWKSNRFEEKGLGFVQFCVRFVDEIRPDLQTGKKAADYQAL